MRKALIACLALALSACGDNIKPTFEPDADTSVPPDAEIEPDAMVCPARAFGEIGGPCDSNDDCGTADSACYFGALGSVSFAPEGYCMVDDFAINGGLGVCVTDGDCGTDEICVEWVDFAGYKSCMPACSCLGNTCPD